MRTEPEKRGGWRSKHDSAANLPTPVADASNDSRSYDQRPATRDPDAKTPMTPSEAMSQLPDRLKELSKLSLPELRQEWRRLFRLEPPRLSRDIMMRTIAHRIQEIAYGGLSRTTERKLVMLAHGFETNGRVAPPAGPRIKPGARLVREWQGRTYVVCVTEKGFEFEGKTYRSLSKIARDITDAHWSGPRFFGLTKTLTTLTSGDEGGKSDMENAYG